MTYYSFLLQNDRLDFHFRYRSNRIRQNIRRQFLLCYKYLLKFLNLVFKNVLKLKYKHCLVSQNFLVEIVKVFFIFGLLI
jgi:hypothetical protein